MSDMAKAVQKKRVFFAAETTPWNTCICERLERNEDGTSKGQWLPWTPLTKPEWRRGKALIKQLVKPAEPGAMTMCRTAMHPDTHELEMDVKDFVAEVEREHGKKIWRLCTWT